MTVKSAMSRAEFIALMAMLFATIAFSIDSMLPALPEIGAELSPDNLNRAQLIITAFMVGLGFGTFLSGPISDAMGRKPVILLGAAVYITGALWAWRAQSLETVLIARAIQGLGAAGPRVVGMAVIRDLYQGRQMARLMSIVMVIFTLVPAVAPLIGSWIIALSDWRGIFLAFVAFSLVGAGWVGVRLEETLPRDERRAFRVAPLYNALKEVLSHKAVLIAISALTLCFAMLMSMLQSVQPIYDLYFGRSDSFPLWFALVCLVAVTSSFVNAALVVRLGMRYLVTVMLTAEIGLAGLFILLNGLGLPEPWGFTAFLIFQVSVFFMAGLVFGNLTAMGMEPLGHIAGMAASVISGVSTILGMLVATPIGMSFDGTPAPLARGIFLLAVVALALMLWLRRLEQRA